MRRWSAGVLAAIVVAVCVAASPRPPERPVRAEAPSFEVAVSLLPVTVSVSAGDVTFKVEF